MSNMFTEHYDWVASPSDLKAAGVELTPGFGGLTRRPVDNVEIR